MPEREGINPEDAEWDYTQRLGDYLRGSRFYEEPDGESPHGYFQGRPIIARDTKINGGVYMVGGMGEALVVDDKKYEQLNKTYSEFTKRAAGWFGKSIKADQKFFKRLLGFSQERLLYNLKKTEEIADQYSADQKISLDIFLDAGVGVCRHQAVLGAYLLEKMIGEGLIKGQVSVDRNIIQGQGGHAWIRYTDENGRVMIIDPAQDYVGPLEDIKKDRWFYERPEDLSLEQGIFRSQSWRDLYKVLEKHGGIRGADNYFYTSQELIPKIDRVRKGELDLSYITRTAGLRDKVAELMEKSSYRRERPEETKY